MTEESRGVSLCIRWHKGFSPKTYVAGPVAVGLAVRLVVDCLVCATLSTDGYHESLRECDDGDDGDAHGDD